VSEAYDRTLVQVESSLFERVGAGLVAGSFLTLLLAWATLFQWVGVGDTVAGVSLFQVFGLAPLVIGLALLGLGLVSARDLAPTAPDRSVGLLTAVVFGLLWFLAAGSLAANTLGLGTLGWLGVGPVAGGLVAVWSLLAREDLGATVPVGVLLVAYGAAVLGPLVDPSWVWDPATLTVAFPAHVAVPLLSMTCALVGGWTAGKAYNGFGTRGRQTGAYLLISLVVFVVLAVLALLVAFIAQRGTAAVLENLTVGAGSGLLVSLVPLAVLGSRLSHGLNTTTRVRAARSAVGVATAAGVVGFAGLCVALLVTGQDLTWGAITLAATPRVGSGLALAVFVTLFAVSRLVYDGLNVLQPAQTVSDRVKTALLALVAALSMLAVVALSTRFADATFSLAVAPLVAAGAVAVATLPLAVLLGRWREGRAVWTTAAAPVTELRLAVGGGLALLLLAVVFEVAGGLVPVASPAIPLVGGLSAVAVAGQLVALSFLAVGVGVVLARFRSPGGAPGRDLTRDLAALAATGLTGALTLLVVHAIATVNELVFLEFVAVSPFGVLDWPFVMNPSQGLGIQTGVMPAIVGTVWLVAGAVVLAVPLAVGAAVYLTEYAEESLLTRGVEVATNGLWSTPSIVFGLFGLAFIVPRFGNNTSLFAGQLVLGFMLLPLVLITSREAMKSVPDEYRDASAALGVSRWETIRSVVIPAAMPGVITGVILGIGRIAGETAPILLVMRGPNFPGQAPNVLGSFQVSWGLEPPFLHVTNPALLDQASALPYQLFAIISAGVGENQAFGWGTALVLLAVVLSFYAIGIGSRRYFRSKLQQ